MVVTDESSVAAHWSTTYTRPRAFIRGFVFFADSCIWQLVAIPAAVIVAVALNAAGVDSDSVIRNGGPDWFRVRGLGLEYVFLLLVSWNAAAAGSTFTKRQVNFLVARASSSEIASRRRIYVRELLRLTIGFVLLPVTVLMAWRRADGRTFVDFMTDTVLVRQREPAGQVALDFLSER